MSTANPFAGKFKVDKDEDYQEVTASNTKPTEQLFTQKDQPKKTKKVRPEKKENQPSYQKQDDEGFEVVSKHKVQKKKEEAPQEEDRVHKEHRPRKAGTRGERGGPFRGNRGGKREFERHSGTGRGREIAKGGAGGKYTWGNNNNNEDYEENNDDYVIEQALNPKVKEEKAVEEPKAEEPKEAAKEEAPAENEQPKEDVKEEKRRKGKKEENKEIPEEEKLHLPENAISLEEFLKSKKTEEKEIVVERPKESENLQVKEKSENYELGTTAPGKKEKKKKEKKNTKGTEVIQDFGVGDSYERRGYQGYQKKQKFKFNEDDFPKMK